MNFENIKIREYMMADKDGCLQAFKSNIPKYFTEGEFSLYETFLDTCQNLLTATDGRRRTYYYVIEYDGEILGCGGFGDKDYTNRITLAWGLVHRSYHKKGLGEKLLEYRLRQLRKYYPHHAVYIDTCQHTYGFFEKFGFKTLKITNEFYAPGLHRYDMVLE